MVRSERAIAVNLISLYKVLGGGWEMEKPQDHAVEKAEGAPEQARR
jgi:hypothetical protein